MFLLLVKYIRVVVLFTFVLAKHFLRSSLQQTLNRLGCNSDMLPPYSQYSHYVLCLVGDQIEIKLKMTKEFTWKTLTRLMQAENVKLIRVWYIDATEHK